MSFSPESPDSTTHPRTNKELARDDKDADGEKDDPDTENSNLRKSQHESDAVSSERQINATTTEVPYDDVKPHSTTDTNTNKSPVVKTSTRAKTTPRRPNIRTPKTSVAPEGEIAFHGLAESIRSLMEKVTKESGGRVEIEGRDPNALTNYTSEDLAGASMVVMLPSHNDQRVFSLNGLPGVSLGITFSKYPKFYKAGDFLKGTVKITADRTIPSCRLSLYYQGMCTVRSQRYQMYDPEGIMDPQDQINDSHTFLLARNGHQMFPNQRERTHDLSPGTYLFKFSILLYDWLPASQMDNWLCIKYILLLEIVLANRRMPLMESLAPFEVFSKQVVNPLLLKPVNTNIELNPQDGRSLVQFAVELDRSVVTSTNGRFGVTVRANETISQEGALMKIFPVFVQRISLPKKDVILQRVLVDFYNSSRYQWLRKDEEFIQSFQFQITNVLPSTIDVASEVETLQVLYLLMVNVWSEVADTPFILMKRSIDVVCPDSPEDLAVLSIPLPAGDDNTLICDNTTANDEPITVPNGAAPLASSNKTVRPSVGSDDQPANQFAAINRIADATKESVDKVKRKTGGGKKPNDSPSSRQHGNSKTEHLKQGGKRNNTAKYPRSPDSSSSSFYTAPIWIGSCQPVEDDNGPEICSFTFTDKRSQSFVEMALPKKYEKVMEEPTNRQFASPARGNETGALEEIKRLGSNVGQGSSKWLVPDSADSSDVLEMERGYSFEVPRSKYCRIHDETNGYMVKSKTFVDNERVVHRVAEIDNLSCIGIQGKKRLEESVHLCPLRKVSKKYGGEKLSVFSNTRNTVMSISGDKGGLSHQGSRNNKSNTALKAATAVQNKGTSELKESTRENDSSVVIDSTITNGALNESTIENDTPAVTGSTNGHSSTLSDESTNDGDIHGLSESQPSMKNVGNSKPIKEKDNSVLIRPSNTNNSASNKSTSETNSGKTKEASNNDKTESTDTILKPVYTNDENNSNQNESTMNESTMNESTEDDDKRIPNDLVNDNENPITDEMTTGSTALNIRVQENGSSPESIIEKDNFIVNECTDDKDQLAGSQDVYVCRKDEDNTALKETKDCEENAILNETSNVNDDLILNGPNHIRESSVLNEPRNDFRGHEANTTLNEPTEDTDDRVNESINDDESSGDKKSSNALSTPVNKPTSQVLDAPMDGSLGKENITACKGENSHEEQFCLKENLEKTVDNDKDIDLTSRDLVVTPENLQVCDISSDLRENVGQEMKQFIYGTLRSCSKQQVGLSNSASLVAKESPSCTRIAHGTQSKLAQRGTVLQNDQKGYTDENNDNQSDETILDEKRVKLKKPKIADRFCKPDPRRKRRKSDNDQDPPGSSRLIGNQRLTLQSTNAPISTESKCDSQDVKNVSGQGENKSRQNQSEKSGMFDSLNMEIPKLSPSYVNFQFCEPVNVVDKFRLKQLFEGATHDEKSELAKVQLNSDDRSSLNTEMCTNLDILGTCWHMKQLFETWTLGAILFPSPRGVSTTWSQMISSDKFDLANVENCSFKKRLDFEDTAKPASCIGEPTTQCPSLLNNVHMLPATNHPIQSTDYSCHASNIYLHKTQSPKQKCHEKSKTLEKYSINRQRFLMKQFFEGATYDGKSHSSASLPCPSHGSENSALVGTQNINSQINKYFKDNNLSVSKRGVHTKDAQCIPTHQIIESHVFNTDASMKRTSRADHSARNGIEVQPIIQSHFTSKVTQPLAMNSHVVKHRYALNYKDKDGCLTPHGHFNVTDKKSQPSFSYSKRANDSKQLALLENHRTPFNIGTLESSKAEWNIDVCRDMTRQHTGIWSHRHTNKWATSKDVFGDAKAILSCPVDNKTAHEHGQRQGPLQNGRNITSQEREVKSRKLENNEEYESLLVKKQWYTKMIRAIEMELCSSWQQEKYERLKNLQEEVKLINKSMIHIRATIDTKDNLVNPVQSNVRKNQFNVMAKPFIPRLHAARFSNDVNRPKYTNNCAHSIIPSSTISLDPSVGNSLNGIRPIQMQTQWNRYASKPRTSIHTCTLQPHKQRIGRV